VEEIRVQSPHKVEETEMGVGGSAQKSLENHVKGEGSALASKEVSNGFLGRMEGG